MIEPTVPAAIPAVAGPAADKRMRDTAREFEASFLAQMMKPMFDSLNTDGTFGGGQAETTWRGFLVDAMAQQTARAGGIGLADVVMAEMIKMQEQGA
jgi:Rod binding domain-containing protein